ncbi:MAG TPA: AI-2E family transporter [Dermatophilaceae bacterium]
MATDPHDGAAAAADHDFSTHDGEARAQRTLVLFDRWSVLKAGSVILGLIAAFMMVLWLFSVTGHFLFLILLAWLFAIALEPGIRRVMGWGRSRGTAAGIVGGSAILAALALATIFGQLFFTQIAALVQSLPDVLTSLIDWVNSTFHLSLDANAIVSSLSITPSQIAGWAESLSGGILGVVGSLGSVVFDLVTVLVFGFYFAGDGPHFFRAIASGLPPQAQRVVVTVSEITTAKTGGYVVSKIVLAAISSFFHGIFFVAIGVPYWLPFAIFVGITAQFVPIVGTYLGVILPVLATVFASPWKAAAIVAFAVVYQQIETYFFTPRVSRRTMDVNPAIALAAVFVGAAIWGPIGAIIGIPLAAAGVAILETYRSRYELVPEMDGVG